MKFDFTNQSQYLLQYYTNNNCKHVRLLKYEKSMGDLDNSDTMLKQAVMISIKHISFFLSNLKHKTSMYDY